MDRAELHNRFIYHAPNDLQAAKYHAIRNRAHELAQFIDSECPDSREKSLAITNIEQSVMWANAAIARHSGSGEGECSKRATRSLS